MADKKLKITLVKSPIGAVPKHRKTVEAMGLNKVNKTVELPDNASTRGQIQQLALPLRQSTLSAASALEPRFPPSSFRSIRALWTRSPQIGRAHV